MEILEDIELLKYSVQRLYKYITTIISLHTINWHLSVN